MMSYRYQHRMVSSGKAHRLLGETTAATYVFDLPHTLTLESIHTSPIVLLGHKNEGVAFGFRSR